MTIAIALYGEYSDWWKKTKYGGNDVCLFALNTFDDEKPPDVYFTDYKVFGSDILPAAKQQFTRAVLFSYYCQHLDAMIKAYEEANDMTFDIIVVSNFKTVVIDFPTVRGVYYTPFYCYETMEIPNPIECFEVVSDTCIRYNGGCVQRLSDLDVHKRKIIFDKLFDGNVCDFEMMEMESPYIAMLIPSVINTSAKPLDYTESRSVFTPDERLSQTAAQIRSIEKLKTVTSILLEGSELDLRQINLINSKIVLFSKDSKAHHYANEHSNKSIYEIYVMNKMLHILPYCKWYFKFGGRYRLSTNFKLSAFTRNKPVYKIIDAEHAFGKKTIVECILYSFPNNRSQEYKDIYNKIILNAQLSSDAIETLLYDNSTDFYTVDSLRVVGKDAIEGFERYNIA